MGGREGGIDGRKMEERMDWIGVDHIGRWNGMDDWRERCQRVFVKCLMIEKAEVRLYTNKE